VCLTLHKDSGGTFPVIESTYSAHPREPEQRVVSRGPLTRELLLWGQALPFAAGIFDTKSWSEVPAIPAGVAARRRVFSVAP
jgi:hypothetical protein